MGQQTLNGKRMGNGFVHRSLPHFQKHSRDPVSRGFVANSFYSGITPSEFWFHTICGREGLIDTAVKTAETGYMQRRLMKALEDLSVQYDNTVRNSEGVVVQFKYGDDCLDPTYMEGVNGKPINFEFLWLTISTQTKEDAPQHLWPFEVLPLLNRFFEEMEQPELFSNLFKEELVEFWKGAWKAWRDKYRANHKVSRNPNFGVGCFELIISKNSAAASEMGKNGQNCFCFAIFFCGTHVCVGMVQKMEQVNKTMGLPVTEADLQVATLNDVLVAVSRRVFSVTRLQLKEYHEACVQKHIKFRIDPGTACGALGATSIGEPATQMTLKTFHFAGIASMNITQGVPRIREIINAVKAISTPIIKVTLENPRLLPSAQIVKARIDQTSLRDICKHISEVYSVGQCYLAVQLDLKTIFDLQLDIGISHVKQAILDLGKKRKLGLAEKHIRVVNTSLLTVYPTNTTSEEMYNNLQNLKQEIPNASVRGLPGVTRAVIETKQGKDGQPETYGLLVEGLDLIAVMGVPGVVPTKTASNHIMKIHEVLGVEAARSLIINEITGTMGSYGLGIDVRHVQQLADVMTFKGPILGIQRHGIMRMKDSVLTLASFERTTDVLFDAAVRGRKDLGIGISESIIMGMNINVGSGSFKLLQKVDRSKRPPMRRPLLSSLKTHHVAIPN